MIRGWFEPTLAGEYDLQCTEICGIGHGIMGARIIVAEEEDHNAWLAEVTPAELQPAISLAAADTSAGDQSN